MTPVRDPPRDRIRLQGYSLFTNRLKRRRENYNEKDVNEFIYVWHPRDNKGPNDDDDNVQSSFFQSSQALERPFQ